MSFDVSALPMLAIVGESHADPMIGAYVRDPRTDEPLAAATYAHIPGLRSEYYMDRAGRINSKIVAALCSLRLMLYAELSDPRALGPTMMEQNLYNPEGGYSWRIYDQLKDTPLLFVSGEIDARHIYRAVPPYADVPVPFAPEATERIPTFAATAMVTEASMTTTVNAVLAPKFRAIELLRTIGFSSIALHSVSPTTADDAQYMREIHHDTRALTRYKVIMLVNAAMRSYCDTNGFMFIDRWADFTEGGLIRDGYGADAVHVKDVHMRTSLGLLYERTLAARAVAA